MAPVKTSPPAAPPFSTAWKNVFHGVEKSAKVFTFYVISAESFYVPWKIAARGLTPPPGAR